MAFARSAELSAASDFELAALAARGDRAAFGVLAERGAPAAFDLLRRMGVQKATAEDIAQDAMIAALKSMHTYRGEAPFTAWVMRIAARLYFKRYAKDARTELMAEPVDPETPAGAGERDSQVRLDLDRALSLLSKGERTCVSLCHGAGMTHEEIAGVTGLPLGTVKSHVNRGLAKLRRLMAAETV